MIEDQGLRSDSQEGIEWWVCAAINFSRNQQIGERGYSPSQWVLGRGLRLPADLLSPMGRFDVAIRAADQPKFLQRLTLMSAAQRALAAQRCSRALATAASSRSRGEAVQTSHFKVGDQVMYWRQTKKKSDWSSFWHGPGIVIGVETPNLWVSHGGSTLKCAPRQLRHCTASEVTDWKTIFEQALVEETRQQPTPTTTSLGEEELQSLTPEGDDMQTDPESRKRRFTDLSAVGAPPLPESRYIPPPPPGGPPVPQAQPPPPAQPASRRWRAGLLTPAVPAPPTPVPVRGGGDTELPPPPPETQ